MLLIAAAAAGSIWRYDVALRHSDVALSSTTNALRVERASTFFWRERETMNEYLLHPAPVLLAEIAEEQSGFEAAMKDVDAGDASERGMVGLSRRGNASFLETFVQNRRFAGIGARAERTAAKQLNAAERGVLRGSD